MIWESSYWKDDLLALARFLTRRTSRRTWGERALVNFEREVFIAFYSIRKLAEAKKLSDSIVEQNIPLLLYPSMGKAVTLMNWHKLDMLYDFEAGIKQSKNLAFVCNQVIHSYVFMPFMGEDGRKLIAILFASDRQRNTGLYRLELPELIRVLRSVGANYPHTVRMTLDNKLKDFIVQSD